MDIRLPPAKAVLFAATFALSASPAFADHQDFTVRNNGGNYVHYVYVSPSSASDWEEDILGDDVMDPYSEMLIDMIGYRDDQCYFDIKVVDENGYERTYYEVDLCVESYVDFP